MPPTLLPRPGRSPRCRIATATVALLASAFASLSTASPVMAGSYLVAVDCNNVRNAWVADRTQGMDAYTTCGGPNVIGIVARVGVTANPDDKVPYGSYAEWRFSAPPGTGVIFGELTGRWSARRGGWQTGAWGTSTAPLVACFTTCETTDSQSFAPPNVSQVWFRAACYGSNGCYRADNGQPAALVALNNATLTLQDDHPAAIISPDADDLGNRWISGPVSLPYFAGDIGSGVRRVELWTHYGGDLSSAKDIACDATRPAPCPGTIASDATGPLTLDPSRLGEGTYTGILRAIDYSGGYSDHTFTYRADRVPPGRPRNIELVGPDGWRRDNGFRLRWTNPDQGEGAPVVAAHYEVCPADDSDSRRCVSGTATGANVDHIDDLRLPDTGVWKAHVWLEDAAGNRRDGAPSDAVMLRFDNRPPSPTTFEPQDPDDPQRLEVRVGDDASGVADGKIEIARHDGGEWKPLMTRLAAGRLRARVDDSGLQDGVYSLRAIASDAAGNTSIGARRTDGEPAELTSPIRLKSRLATGFLRVRRVGRRGHRRTVVRLLPRLHTRYRRHPTIRGRLLTADGQPLAGQRIVVTSQTTAITSKPRIVGVVDTDRNGRFRYRTIARSSRTLTFSYNGSEILRPVAQRLGLVVPASSSIHVDRRKIVNGQSVTFSGRLRGGHIPRGGKGIELQYYTAGVGWRLFAYHIRADRHGRWRLRYPIQGVEHNIRFPLRLSIKSEAAYPYATGHSRKISIVVRAH